MPKRFIDTEIWKKGWFLDLTPEEKAAWFYLLTNCDAVGVVDTAERLANFMVGTNVNWKELIKKSNGHIETLNNGNLFIVKYCDIQYGDSIKNLESKSKPIMSHQALLRKHGLLQRVSKGFVKGIERVPITLKEKEKDKLKVKENKEEEEKNVYNDHDKHIPHFLKEWKKHFPDKKNDDYQFNIEMGKWNRMKSFMTYSLDEISQAIKNFSECVRKYNYTYMKPWKLTDRIGDFVDESEPLKRANRKPMTQDERQDIKLKETFSDDLIDSMIGNIEI